MVWFTEMKLPQRQKREIRSHGIRLLLSTHPEIRKLKCSHFPCLHGNRLWTSSWLLMDFFTRRGLPGSRHVMEVGCGWGLASIYCAKRHNAAVTAVDLDPEVFPYLHLHALINGVKVFTMKRAFGGLGQGDLEGIDVLMGADVCFWDKMILSLKRLINRGLRAGVRLVLIADPGRSPFNSLCDYYAEREGAHILDWTVRHPRRIQGRILKIGSLE